MHYVYAHKHPQSDEIVYIGCGKEVRMFCKNRKPNHLIWLEDMLVISEMNKIVKVLFVYEDRAEALEKEKELIKEHKPEFNLVSAVPPTQEHRDNVSKAKMGHEVTDETKAKISKTKKGHEVSAETRAKISSSMKRRANG